MAPLELADSVGTHEVARLSPGMAARVRVTVEGSATPLAGLPVRSAPAAEAGIESLEATGLFERWLRSCPLSPNTDAPSGSFLVENTRPVQAHTTLDKAVPVAARLRLIAKKQKNPK